MSVFREILAVVVFCAGLFLGFTLILDAFTWSYVVAAVVCFLAAYFIWPSKKRGQRDSGHWLLDILEIFIELPVEVMLWLLRLVVRIFRTKDGGIDIDF